MKNRENPIQSSIRKTVMNILMSGASFPSRNFTTRKIFSKIPDFSGSCNGKTQYQNFLPSPCQNFFLNLSGGFEILCNPLKFLFGLYQWIKEMREDRWGRWFSCKVHRKNSSLVPFSCLYVAKLAPAKHQVIKRIYSTAKAIKCITWILSLSLSLCTHTCINTWSVACFFCRPQKVSRLVDGTRTHLPPHASFRVLCRAHARSGSLVTRCHIAATYTPIYLYKLTTSRRRT